MTFPKEILDRLEQSGVVAGFSINRIEQAVPLCRALMAGGIDAIELTLRTPVALDALRSISAELPGLLKGVGTILAPDMVKAAKEAGADFGLAPGMNPRVVKAARAWELPFAPGISTPSDLEAAIELGCRFVKFFPAGALGGLTYLRAMAVPYRHLGIQYFPLGGVNPDNMLAYLQDDLVPVVGGSWMVHPEWVEAGDWDAITAHAAGIRKQLDDAKP